MYISEYRKIIPFILCTLGGTVVHSYGRLILHERAITDRHQLQPPNNDTGDGRIECAVSSGVARFRYFVENGISYSEYNVPPAGNQKASAVILADDFSNFVNIEGGCSGIYHYLFLSRGDIFACSCSMLHNMRQDMYMHILCGSHSL